MVDNLGDLLTAFFFFDFFFEGLEVGGLGIVEGLEVGGSELNVGLEVSRSMSLGDRRRSGMSSCSFIDGAVDEYNMVIDMVAI
jgi:hypothetical protein